MVLLYLFLLLFYFALFSKLCWACACRRNSVPCESELEKKGGRKEGRKEGSTTAATATAKPTTLLLLLVAFVVAAGGVEFPSPSPQTHKEPLSSHVFTLGRKPWFPVSPDWVFFFFFYYREACGLCEVLAILVAVLTLASWKKNCQWRGSGTECSRNPLVLVFFKDNL